jgi:hypothetical protein
MSSFATGILCGYRVDFALPLGSCVDARWIGQQRAKGGPCRVLSLGI